jgi:imidazole glycerol-phosphate synthase subunit HisF
MNKTRIIPRLDIKGENIIKGIHLEGLRIIGDPQEFATKYFHEGADEILYVDTVASLYGRNNLVNIVERASKDISIPLCVAGGIRTLEDIKKLLHAGADKVSINTAAIENPMLIKEASEYFGSQCIVVAIDYKVWPDDRFRSNVNRTVGRGKGEKNDSEIHYQVYTDNGRQQTGYEAYEWALKAVSLGAGEILLTSIDCEGIKKGFELEFTKKISESISVPVIAGGGAGSAQDVADVIKKGKADAVSIASILHYKDITITELKNFMSNYGIPTSDHNINENE